MSFNRSEYFVISHQYCLMFFEIQFCFVIAKVFARFFLFYNCIKFYFFYNRLNKYTTNIRRELKTNIENL